MQHHFHHHGGGQKGVRRYSMWQIIQRLWPFFRPEGKLFILTLVFVGFKVGADTYLALLCRGILNIIENFVMGGARGARASLADVISFTVFGKHQSLTTADLPMIIGLMCATMLVFLSAGYVRSLFPAILISNVTFNIRRALYGHLQCMDLYFFDRNRSGEISSRLINDISQGVNVFGMTITIFLYQLVLLIASVYFMLRINILLTLAAIGVGLLFVVNMQFLVPRLRTQSREVQEKLGKISGELTEKFSGIKVMQSFTNEDLEMRIFTERIDEHRNSSIRMAWLSSFTGIFGQTIPMIGDVVILGLGALYVLKGELTIANLTFFWMMRERLFSPFQVFAHFAEQMAMGLGGLDRVFEFFTMRSKVTDRPGAIKLCNVRGEVEFCDVCFSYDNERGQAALSNISFRVEPGMSVALVGASGAGKTTTVDLLSRFYDPSSGCIRIDGKDIRDYTLESLRDNIGVVMQEAILFSGTLKENVRYGNPKASDADVIEALKMANAWDFVCDMKDGLHTVIGERGVSLSGGQRQRIAIARAFLKNPRILVLDEATSALDSVSELFVQEAIERLMKNRTTFVIAHRLSTIAHVDRILVLDKGKLVEQGAHEELLCRKGHYAAFYMRQFGRFERRTVS